MLLVFICSTGTRDFRVTNYSWAAAEPLSFPYVRNAFESGQSGDMLSADGY